MERTNHTLNACYRVFEILTTIKHMEGETGSIVGFTYGNAESVYKKGFDIIYDSGFTQPVEIVGPPCGLNEMSTFAHIELSKGTGEAEKHLFMIFI